MEAYCFKHYRGGSGGTTAGVLIAHHVRDAHDTREAIDHVRANFLDSFNPETDFAVLYDAQDRLVWERDDRHA